MVKNLISSPFEAYSNYLRNIFSLLQNIRIFKILFSKFVLSFFRKKCSYNGKIKPHCSLKAKMRSRVLLQVHYSHYIALTKYKVAGRYSFYWGFSDLKNCVNPLSDELEQILKIINTRII